MQRDEAGQPLVLVVEDNQANRLLCRVLLARAGCRVAEAASVAGALGALAGQPPELILMDVQLPDGDGLDLVRRLKADPTTAAIPVLAVTAYAMSGDRERALKAGCCEVLTKPLDTRAFADRIRVALAERPAASGGV